jgi:hypothetical protein
LLLRYWLRRRAAAQIRVEGRWATRATELDLLGDIAEEGDLECPGDGGGDLGLELQHIP